MSITDTQPASVHSNHPSHSKADVLQVIVYGHSGLFYWWPLWTAGYVMALLTWLHHDQVAIGTRPEWFHPSRNLGVIYTLLLLLLILVTSTAIKGMKAALIIATLAFFALLFCSPELVGCYPGLAQRPIDFHELWLLHLLLIIAFLDLAYQRIWNRPPELLEVPAGADHP